jgi:hypothetical protein
MTRTLNVIPNEVRDLTIMLLITQSTVPASTNLREVLRSAKDDRIENA